MSTTLTMPQIAPVLKVRAALRRRSERPSVARVESIEDSLMLGWTEEQIRRMRDGGQRIVAMEEELQDLTALARATVGVPAEQVSQLERMLLFTKLEAAKGLLRQLRQLVALTALVVLGYVAVDFSDDGMAFARARSARVVRVVKARREMEGAA